MKKRYGKYFRQNMRLFTAVFVVIGIIAAGVYLWRTSEHQAEKIRLVYQSDAQRYADELDNRLANIRRMINDISQITWVKKLSTSSDVFMKKFDELQRLECQTELARYLSADGAVSDIAIYIADRGKLLSQKGWFTEAEYRAYNEGRVGLSMDAVFAAANQKTSLDAFGEAVYNVESEKSLVLIKNLIDISSPTSSLLLILNKDVFSRSLTNMCGENLFSVRVLNALDSALLSSSGSLADGYRIHISSAAFPLFFEFTFRQPSALLAQYHIFSLPFILSLLLALVLAMLVSFLLSLHSSRPIQRLVTRIDGVTGGEPPFTLAANEFEHIENSFVALYTQKQDLESGIQKNRELARRYALMLILSGNERFLEWTRHFEALGIAFTQEQVYTVFSVLRAAGGAGKIDLTDLMTELRPQIASAEEIELNAGQFLLIVGERADETPPNYDEIAEWMKALALQRQNVLLEIGIGKPCGPGILGISQSYRGLIQSAREPQTPDEAEKPGTAIVSYVTEHFCDQEMSLKELGARWNLSVPTVSRLYKEACGTSFLDHLTSLRLEKAKELLRLKTNTIPEIAAAVGYASEYSFRRAFLRNENCRPQDWLGQDDL